MQPIKRWWAAIATRLRLGRRSDGVRVRRETIAHIRAGNAARTQQAWRRGADAYREALVLEPHLQHVWVQLGHMEKEAGAIDRAAAAYAEAARLKPDDAAPLLHLGHMAKSWRLPAEAAGHFVAALRRAPRNLEATSELVRLLPDRDDVDPGLWADILDVLEIDPDERMADDTDALSSGALVFDVTDLLAFFGQRRLPTGIQRVQIEVSLACLEQTFAVPPLFCVYASARRGWVRLSPRVFMDICRLARQSDDVDDLIWTTQLDRTYRHIAVTRTLRFASGTVLVNLGTSWADRNYLLDVRNVRAQAGVIYVPLVFDLIPLIDPTWFIRSLVRDYRAWFGSLLHSADGFLAISEATRHDLLRIAPEWHAPISASSVPVVRLDGDFRHADADPDTLGRYGLKSGCYVLFVSTLEPRKNHRGAFEAWLDLADTIGDGAMPRLVCVGGRGWLNEDLHRMLHKRPRLRRMVRILHGVPDDALATLYEQCLFAVYPSFYEGWGLPVSEALSYGKVPAISRVSSLPEAGGAFACYFDPGDAGDIAKTVRTLLDPGVRMAREDAIREGYHPRSWHAIALDLIDKAQIVTSRSNATIPSLANTGVWTLALPRRVDDFDKIVVDLRHGEMLRHGRAWQPPGLEGCRIEGDDATLRFRWAGPPGSVLEIYFAALHQAAEVRATMGGFTETHRLDAGRAGRIVCPLPHAPTTLEAMILPLAGEIVVEKIVIAQSTDGSPH